MSDLSRCEPTGECVSARLRECEVTTDVIRVISVAARMPSGTECGRKSRALYDRIRGIQDGIEEDPHGWCVEV